MATTAAPPTTPGAVEAPLTLDEPPRKVLGLADQTVLWFNLGVSLLLPATATFLLTPDPSVAPLSLAAALVAILVGSVIGNALLGLGAVPGAQTGAPSMVLLRGLLGRRGSYVPTALNLAQCVGWSIFEIVIIAEAAARLTDDSLRPLFVVLAGAIATLMAVRPLGVVHVLKKVAVWLVLASTVYLFGPSRRSARGRGRASGSRPTSSSPSPSRGSRSRPTTPATPAPAGTPSSAPSSATRSRVPPSSPSACWPWPATASNRAST
jgi:NCS1 family nucleobase:cation symporter-1